MLSTIKRQSCLRSSRHDISMTDTKPGLCHSHCLVVTMSRSRTPLATHRWTDAGAGDLTPTPRIRSQVRPRAHPAPPEPSQHSNLSSLINTASPGDGITCHISLISQWQVHSSAFIPQADHRYLYPLYAFSCDRINWHFSLEDCGICRCGYETMSAAEYSGLC